MSKWQKTKWKGVRYYEHPTRKHGKIQKDRYFNIRYRVGELSIDEGVGWLSDGWTASDIAIQLARFKKNAKTGKRPVSFADEKALSDEAKELERQEREQTDRDNVIFDRYFEESYLPVSKSSKKVSSWTSELNHFGKWLKPILGSRLLKEIKPLDIERVKKKLIDAKRSPRYIEYCLATFRQVWNQARRDGLVNTESPTKLVKRPKVNNRRVRFLSRDEAQRLLAELKSRSQQLYNVSLLSLHCGLRLSEIARLKWADVDIDRGTLAIIDGKGSKNRTAFLTPEVKAMLEGIGRGNPDALVFSDRKGNKVQRISYSFTRAVDALKLNEGITDRRQRLVFHSLRHTFASWLVEAGTDLYLVKELLGHSSIVMTERYSHLRPDHLQNAVRSLEGSLNPAAEEKAVKVINL